jgi:acyl-CoA synthetase (AMP-forming)/AMP-acid ligase II
MTAVRAIVRPGRILRSAAPLAEAETLPQALHSLVESSPDFAAITFVGARGRGRHLTLGELWERVRQVHNRLSARGVGPGATVVLILPTGPDAVAGYFGALLAGARPTLLATPSQRLADPAGYLARIGAIVEHARASAVLCDPAWAALLAGDGASTWRRRLLTTADVDGASETEPVPARGEDVASIQYSSGSTGFPKGVTLSHRAILNNIRTAREVLGLLPSETSVSWLPLYHDMGLVDGLLVPLLSGSRCVLIPTPEFVSDPALWLRTVDRQDGAISFAPNFAYNLCARRLPDSALLGLDLSRWRVAAVGSEPVLAETLEAFGARFERYGFRPEALCPGWGLAENVTLATSPPALLRPRIDRIDTTALAEGLARPVREGGMRVVSVGSSVPRCRVEVRDPRTGDPLPERHVGRVWVSSDSLFSGYLDAPELTAQVLRDGWLDTGDNGYLADGDLFFVGRDKDMIVIGGEKYAPDAIEATLNRLEGVRQGCVVAFGVPNPRRGTEEIGAVIETRLTDPAARADLEREARRAVLEEIGQALRYVLLVEPGGVVKTTSGKLARGVTRARYEEHLTPRGPAAAPPAPGR